MELIANLVGDYQNFVSETVTLCDLGFEGSNKSLSHFV